MEVEASTHTKPTEDETVARVTFVLGGPGGGKGTQCGLLVDRLG